MNFQCVYWYLFKALNDTIPNGYHSSIKNHPVKYLKRPIPGKYSKDCENPSTPDPIIEEIQYTDQEGLVTFNDLRFSKAGPIGKYTVGFSCAANTVYSKRDVLVQTSIVSTKIKFVQKYPTSVVVSDVADQEYDFVFIIEVLDKNEAGVPGKYPSQIITTTNKTSDKDNIEISMADEIALFEASKDDGVMTIPIKVTKLLDTTLANITIVIDGINVTTTYIEFYLDEDINKNAISKVEFTQIPIDDFERGIKINKQFIVKAVAYNLLGQKITFDGYSLHAGIYFNPNSQAQIPEDFFKFNTTSTTSGTEITFTCMFTRAPTGHFYFGVFAYFKSSFDSPDFNVFMYSVSSRKIRVYTYSQIDIAVVVGYSLDTGNDVNQLDFKPLRSMRENDTEEYIEIKMGTRYICQIAIASFDTGLIKNTEIGKPTFEFAEYPPSMKALDDPLQSYFKVDYYTTKTDENGYYYVAFTVNYGGIGAYISYYDFGSCISIPMSYKTQNTLKSITIITEPDYRDSTFDNFERKAVYVGRFFDYKARVRIEVTEGPKSGYIVLAQPQNLTDNIFSLDILPQSQFKLDEQKQNYFGWVTISFN